MSGVYKFGAHPKHGNSRSSSVMARTTTNFKSLPHYVFHLLLLLFITTSTQARLPPAQQADPENTSSSDSSALVQTWAEAARGWFVSSVATAEAGGSSRDPDDVAAAFGLPSGAIARDVSRLSRMAIRVYAAVAEEDEMLTATLPDGPMSRSGAHHGVLLLDPFPAARFGHPVLLFFVDKGLSERRCATVGGRILESGECLQVARKNRCPNLMAPDRSSSGGGGGGGSSSSSTRPARHRHLHGRCAVSFLPLVRSVLEAAAGVGEQRLWCREDVSGFSSSCPALRTLNATRHVECDPLRLNTHRCDTTHAAVRPRCRLFQTCDHAVLLSGGWNRQLSDSQSLVNVLDFYEMLRRNGFHEDNIKIFFGNGMPQESGRPAMLSAVMKLALRYHLRDICENTHCADSLVVYLNSPARTDGSPLLWDLDNNGEADETEVYTVRELLRDVQGCAARRVLLIADQSYSGELVRAVQSHASTSSLSNVLVFASGSSSQPAWQGDYTAHWSRATHRHSCLQQVHESATTKVLRSHPTLLDTSSGEATRSTLAGAPCGATARALTDHERRAQFEGCQNVPTRVWLLGDNDAR